MAKDRAKSRRRRRDDSASAAVIPTLAERHEFGAGLLGHDFTASQWLVNVSEKTTLGIDAAFACLRIVCDAVAGSDVQEYQGDDQVETLSLIVRQPDPDMTQWEFLWGLSATLMLYNAAWVQPIIVDDAILGVKYVAPPRVTSIGGELYVDAVKVRNQSTMRLIRRAVFPTLTVDMGEIIHLAREVFAAEMAAGAYRSDYWQQGGAPVTILESDQVIPNEVAEAVSDRWVTQRTTSPGKPAVLSRGIKAKAFGSDLGTEGANIAGDKLKASVARFFGVPPFLVNVASEAGSLTYATVEQEGLHFVKYTVFPYCKVISDMLGGYLSGNLDTGRRVKIDPRRLTEADQLSRYTSWESAIRAGWLGPEEVRKKEGWAPGAPERVAETADVRV